MPDDLEDLMPTGQARRWRRIQQDPDVIAAHAALDAWDEEEKRLSLALGRALRRAQKRIEEEDEHVQQ